MMFIIFLSLIVSCIVALPVEETYKSQYEDVDVDGILQSDRLLKNYVDCLLDRGRCPPPAKELKGYIGDALETDCAKCTTKQKTVGQRAIEFLMDNKPAMWTELQAKYDPQGIFLTRWKAKHEAEGKSEPEVPPTE